MKTNGDPAENSIVLCQIVTEQLDPLEITMDSWPQLVEMAEEQRLEPMLWRALRQAGLVLEAGLEQRLEFAQQHTAIMNMLLEEELRRVDAALADSQIRAIWLKGLGLAHTVYPNAMLRPMGDLDVLVPYDHREEALRLVQTQGYYFSDDTSLLFDHGEDLFLDTLHHYHLRRDGQIVTLLEIHFRLLGRNPDLLPAEELIWFFDQTMDLQIGEIRCQTLHPDAHLLYLCAHAIIQHGEGVIDLLHFLDIHLLVTGSELDWDLIVERAYELRWSYALERALERTSMLFGTVIPDEVIPKLRSHRSAEDQVEWAQILRQEQDATQWDRIQMMLRRMPIRSRLRMMWRIAFPPAAYMRSRYEIAEGEWVLTYYVRRWWGQARQIACSVSQRIRRQLSR